MANVPDFQTKKVLIMASGNGSNFEAIIKHFKNKGLDVCVNFELLCDKKGANVLNRAKTLNIPAFCVEFDDFSSFLSEKKYDLYVLAGFMRILPDKILKILSTDGIQDNVINIHPSLLPKFRGKNAIKRAFEAGVKKTGVSIHFVNKKLDGGKIIYRHAISAKDVPYNKLESEIHALEHAIYPEIIENLLFKKNVLIFGGGAREHAIARKISVSPFLNKLYLAKPNDGFKNLGETIDFIDYNDLLKKSVAKKIDLLVIGPEAPLFDGLSDIFQNAGISVIGPNKDWAHLEESKIFAKEFMQKNGIKTGKYIPVSSIKGAKQAIETFKNLSVPVIKADGPALGKGVSLPETFLEAEKTAKAFLDGKFGDASKKILIEERLSGKEVSVMSLWDGDTLLSFPPALDYKRLLDVDKGPNTGGMGAVAPNFLNENEQNQIKKYLKTLEAALKNEHAEFTGIVYSGLILTPSGPAVLEYNMRFGDPECQALLELLDTDILFVFLMMAKKALKTIDLRLKRTRAYCLTLAAAGYPENPKKGAKISGFENAEKYGCKVYFAGVKASKTGNGAVETSKTPDNSLITNGGRVLSIVKSGKNALQDIYKAANAIHFDGKMFRKDIGKSFGSDK